MEIYRLGHRLSCDSEMLMGESQTIPDQSLTVRDIITRYRCGTMTLPPIEDGEPDDIDAPLSQYDDIVDAAEDFERGAATYSDLLQERQRVENPDISDNKPDDIPVDDVVTNG